MGSIPEEPASTGKRTVATDFLIVGAGPAGASLACFLGRLGLKGILISAANGPAKTPRAHLTNPPALECKSNEVSYVWFLLRFVRSSRSRSLRVRRMPPVGKRRPVH